MPTYTLVVQIPNAGDKEIRYSLNIEGSYESYPQDYFLKAKNKEKLRESIQNESARKINNAHLDYLIKSWIAEIEQGLPSTTIKLNLPPETGLPSKSTLTSPIGNPDSTPAASGFSPSIPVPKPSPIPIKPRLPISQKFNSANQPFAPPPPFSKSTNPSDLKLVKEDDSDTALPQKDKPDTAEETPLEIRDLSNTPDF